MAKIHILDDETINKIAAGEVVERPVSVVKELVENAIDAGATNISVEIKGGGIDYIRVTDNGSGIEKDSIAPAFLRHATSKIENVNDLFVIRSLGFRGEALSSVSAVSKVELLTKTKDSVFGSCYRIEGGREMSFDDAGTPDGTTIIVKDLFYNTPARRKFLKSAVTEGNLITELMERLILSHPGISFKFISSGSLKLTSSQTDDTFSDIYAVFGRDVAGAVTAVESANGDIKVRAFVGKPEIARGNKKCEIFFVNGRYVKNSVLSSAVEEAYKPFLMLHRFPFVILYIDASPDKLDINIHPAKTQIKFTDDKTVYDLIFETVTSGLKEKELIPEALKEFKKPDTDGDEAPEKDTMPPEPFEVNRITQYLKPEHVRNIVPTDIRQETFEEVFLSETARKKHRIIGQVFDTYWIIEYDKKMYMIDQHAAHEKVLYERIKKQAQTGPVSSQLLSPPVIVSLSGSQESTVKQYFDDLYHMGFAVEHFGQREYALTAVPYELFGMDEKDFFISVIDDLNENTKAVSPEHVKDRIATMSCKAAVKGNTVMTVQEADALIDELLSLDNPYNCPHGRPTVISFSQADIEKMFKRIV